MRLATPGKDTFIETAQQRLERQERQCHCVFSGTAPSLACLLSCWSVRPLVSLHLLTGQYRPTTWYVRWSLTNSRLKMEITIAGCTTWTEKNKVRRRQKKL